MLRVLATGVVLLAAGGVLGSPTPRDTPKPLEPGKFLSAAITTGLEEDGVPPALAAEISKRDDFLGKCRICAPTHDAFVAYGKRDKIPAAKEGKGLTEELVTRVRSE